MIDGTLLMMLVVALVVSFAILGVFIWGAKGGQFDDGEKMMGGLLFDSTEDLNDARKKEQKKMNAKKQQKKSKLDK
ncbi:cbb3-type cytochrome oxidase assembly protein CcoS [Malaciobacter canalis]|uniref:Cbb3-type cytochrome oxidase assembly protein CcoS n=1 Tax=Malaciobacter canalis TaxID=1912871 RepID=A0ABX4LNB1_9BACT|nr:cbb3-type cytochrome oxidase assembly protein CcoS [Malaciobacter canalis]PHO09369.1 cbb3-type cytochrome oxidase assembly protein CcoS [Malaciobacter canalis]QEE32182.1 cytochrome oxidase maturation protein, cbb3-type [Malaciobacter canalis]